jgi:ketosteroid isomerase-like protein
VTLSLPEAASVEGPAAIVELWSAGEGADLKLTIEQSDVRVNGDHAQATLRVNVGMRYPGSELREIRTVNADLARRGGTFRVTRLVVSAPLHDQPEPRP